MTAARRGHATGVACALGAGLAWGLVFVAPVLLPEYPPTLLAFGRYLAFGLIALPLAWHDRAALGRLARSDWAEALRLAAVGNIAYYLCLAAAIQAAGVPLPTMIIGTLPVVIAVCANLGAREFAWSRLAPALLPIALGIACVNLEELGVLDASAVEAPGARPPRASAAQLSLGALLATVAVVCWTWYPIRNARWLKRRADFGSGTWATAQGIATLPLAAIGMAAVLAWPGRAADAGPLGPRPAEFVALMLLIGLVASWLGTRLWNRASMLLPTALAGQLIVFETLAALAYGYLWRGAWPGPLASVGIALLVAGVVIATRRLAGAPLGSAA